MATANRTRTLQLFTTPSKTYATPENAVKALDKAVERLVAGEDVNFNISYIMSVTKEGRYFCVLPHMANNEYMGYFLHCGFCVC